MDFDIHGIVGIRLVNPQKSDVDFLTGKIGKFRKELDREPDIVFHFRKKLDIPSFTHLGYNAHFTKDSFYALSRKGNLKIKIPFGTIGDKTELLVESGFYDIPWFFDIINLTFLKKGFIPLHATAFRVDDTGIMVLGWSKGGKTESLMAFGNHGAHYVGDEWVILSADGARMYGIPVPICIWKWQFEHIPAMLPKIGLQRKVLFGVIHVLNFFHTTIKRLGFGNSFISSILNKAMPLVNDQLNIRVSSDKVFRERQSDSARLDKLVLCFSHSSQEFQLKDSDYSDLVRYALNSNLYEQAEFFNLYRAYKFAFPESRNDFLENIESFQYDLLIKAFRNKQSFIFYHPYPVKFEDIYMHLKRVTDAD